MAYETGNVPAWFREHGKQHFDTIKFHLLLVYLGRYTTELHQSISLDVKANISQYELALGQ